MRSDSREGVGGCRSELRNGLKDICWVWPRASEILANHQHLTLNQDTGGESDSSKCFGNQ